MKQVIHQINNNFSIDLIENYSFYITYILIGLLRDHPINTSTLYKMTNDNDVFVRSILLPLHKYTKDLRYNYYI